MSSRRLALVLCLAGAPLVPATAGADPILLVRSGYLDVASFSGFGGELNVRGTDLSLEREFAIRTFTGFGVFGPGFCFPCPPGTDIDLLAHWLGDLPGTVTLDGRTLSLRLFDVFDPDTAHLAVTFSGATVAPPIDGGVTAITAPFRFRGTLLHQMGLETETLRGGGIATLWLEPLRLPIGPDVSEDAWVFSRARYEFVDPIPEPATVLLLGAGLAGLAGRAYRRRHTSRVPRSR